MMIELGKTKRQSVRTICEGSSEALVRGAVEGTLGRVWVPDLDNAPYCLIVVGDFAYLLGLPPKGVGALDLKSQIYESASHACLYPQNERWNSWLEDELSGRLRMVRRYVLKQDEGCFDRGVLEQYVGRIPKEYRIRKMDERLYNLAVKEEWSRDLCVSFEDYKHLEDTGFGYVATKGHKIAAGCLAYSASEGVMEVRVKTQKEHRRKGLALACSAAVQLECMEKEVVPSWEATDQRSVELAQKLGYVHEKEYEVYQVLEEE